MTDTNYHRKLDGKTLDEIGEGPGSLFSAASVWLLVRVSLGLSAAGPLGQPCGHAREEGANL